jgi:hypothetical protein
VISTKRFEESNVFDVISTFNVADHTDMLTLLLLTRPLLKPGGALLTTMFLQKKKPKSNKNVAPSTMAYLYLEVGLLGVPRTSWASVFGFRAVGYKEGSVTSPACRVTHQMAQSDSAVSSLAKGKSTHIWFDSQTRHGVRGKHPTGA